MKTKQKKTKSKTNTKQNKRNTKKTFFFNPSNPKLSYDVYIDKNPKDTIHIKYTTLEDVKTTIAHLETLYKQKKYSHKRIWQVAMIMRVRLKVLQSKKPLHYKLANNYFKFLGARTKLSENDRYKSVFSAHVTRI